MINVTLASSINLLRDGIHHILEARDDIKVVGEYTSAAEICARDCYHKDEILVIADPLADLNEHSVREIVCRFPPARFILVARTTAMRALLDHVKSSARGLVSAESAVSSLPEAISAVSADKAYISVELMSLFSQDMRLNTPPSGYGSLSHREIEVLAAIAAGKKNCSIGCELDISSKTVSTHKTRLMEKLGVGSVAELVQFALQNNLLDARGIGDKHLPKRYNGGQSHR